MADRLWLIGMMGSGKSTVGRMVARALDVPHRDTDQLIEDRAGMSISDLFETIGVVAFRDLERQAVASVALEPGAVISTGGGAVLDPDNRATMRSTGTVVFLRATPDTLARRTGRPGTRPLLSGSDPVAVLTRLADERSDLYMEAADHVIDVDDLSQDEVVRAVEELWNAS